MQKWIKLMVLGWVAAGFMLMVACSKDEPQEPVGNTGGAGVMPMAMEHDMGEGMHDMEGMPHDAGGMGHAMMAETTDGGAVLFQQHCAVCHPGGSNIITPEKTLDRKTLEKNGITSVADIVATMRKPGPGMTTFGPEVLSDEEAQQVAEHILSSY